MTTRWEKGDEHVILVVEGENPNANAFKSALEIDINANIIIDLSRMDKLDAASVKYLNEFAQIHKAKHLSILATSKNKISGFSKLELVPTLPEARDLIFMEITERELGFFGEEE